MSDPMRPKRLAEFRRLLNELRQEAKEKGLDKLSMRQIDAEIAPSRKTRGKKKTAKQPAA